MAGLKDMLTKGEEAYQVIAEYEKNPKKLFEKLDALSS
jgi:hypothetical protein